MQCCQTSYKLAQINNNFIRPGLQHMRRGHMYRQREKQFNNSFSVNEICMPTYNALQDPYLSGFFDKPYIKKHLKQMQLVKRKRRSVSHSNRPNTTNGIYELGLHRFKLPMIQNMGEIGKGNPEQEYPRTASTGHRKRVVAKSLVRASHSQF